MNKDIFISSHLVELLVAQHGVLAPSNGISGQPDSCLAESAPMRDATNWRQPAQPNQQKDKTGICINVLRFRVEQDIVLRAREHRLGESMKYLGCACEHIDALQQISRTDRPCNFVDLVPARNMHRTREGERAREIEKDG